MFREDNIAAAQIAQIFGSELLKVQQSAKTDSGHTPDIVKLDPKQFLMNSEVVNNQKKIHEQQLIRRLQMEAEAACPLPEIAQPIEAKSPTPNPSTTITGIQSSRSEHSPPVKIAGGNWETQLERIAISLEIIAKAIQPVVKKPKKKKIVSKNESKI